ncbi:MAG TPA: HEAT repeat domain-containing protein [Pyrinomonadaceae bacterium]|nr:HEAT repeat domain-containing protein [Pyrinomonadaceae bacterium]
MSNKLLLRVSLVIILALTAIPVMAQQQQRAANALAAQSSSNTTATTVYNAARDLITDGNWAKAQEKFREYVNSYPNEKNLDAALYWMAYAQYKLTNYDQCRETLAKLLEKYSDSTWRDDARMLLAQVPGALLAAARADQAVAVERLAAGVATTSPVAIARAPDGIVTYTPAPSINGVATTAIAPLAAQSLIDPTSVYVLDELDRSVNSDDPCEFKIVVLQALFQTDLQRGIMAATDWVKPGSNQTVRCKSAALTLLSRNGGKAVTPVILGIAKNETDMRLRARAISTLGTSNDDSVIEPLRDFALNSTQSEIGEAALYALSRHSSDRATAVLSDIALNGKTPAQRKAAIASISTRAGDPPVDALLRIYDADQSLEIRKAVINGFVNRRSERVGNKLFDIARSSDNVELRKAAVSAISRRGGDKAVEFLLGLYDTEKDEQVKDQIIYSLGSGNAFHLTQAVSEAALVSGQHVYTAGGRTNDQRVVRKLIEVAKDPQAPMERRKRAIGWLSRSKDPEVLKFLEELLK